MNKEMVQGHRKEIKGKLKQQWSKLTEDAIGEMKGILQKNYGYQKEEAKKEIELFLHRYH